MHSKEISLYKKKKDDIPCSVTEYFGQNPRIWDELQVPWKHDAGLHITQPVH